MTKLKNKLGMIDMLSFSMIMTVIVAHLLALISPGPDFLLVVRSAIRNTRRKALGVALGIAFANGFYIGLCILGVGTLIAHSVFLMIGLKLFGGLFLIYVAYHALQAKPSDYQFIAQKQSGMDNKKTPTFWQEFILGVVSGLSNPKNIIFYLSLFSVILTPNVNTKTTALLGVWMTFIVFAWDSLIILFLSQQKIRKVFSKVAFYFDKFAGVFLGFIGLKLVHSAIRN